MACARWRRRAELLMQQVEYVEISFLSNIGQLCSNACVAQDRVAGAAEMCSLLEAQALRGRSPCLVKMLRLASNVQQVKQPANIQAWHGTLCGSYGNEAKVYDSNSSSQQLQDCASSLRHGRHACRSCTGCWLLQPGTCHQSNSMLSPQAMALLCCRLLMLLSRARQRRLRLPACC